jgi:hypothetical protein
MKTTAFPNSHRSGTPSVFQRRARWFALLLHIVAFALIPNPNRADGTLTCGQISFGGMGGRGDSNTWTFTANAGDTIIVQEGSLVLTGTNSLDALMKLFGPAGTQLAVAGGTAEKASEISLHLTNSGNFKLVIYDVGNPGGYRMDLTTIGCTNAGPTVRGPMTNGLIHTGSVDVGMVETWTFDANAGDGILVRMGNTSTNGTLDPYLRLYDPNGALVDSVGGYGFKAEEVSARAASTGTYTVVVNGNGAPFGRDGGSGPYRLTLVKTGSSIVTAADDQGGAITNGFMHTGTITLGDADLWTFNAKTGEGIMVWMGNTSTNGHLDPWLRVYGPDGALVVPLYGGYGYKAEGFNFRAPTNGVFIVVLTGGSYPNDGEGSYRLTVAKTGDPIITAPGDQGGPMTNGFMHTGRIDLGDLDVWTFNAKAGDGIMVRMGNTTTNGLLDPYLRIFGPDGAMITPLAVGGYGYAAEDITFRATSSGLFTVLLNGGSVADGGEGDYRLTVAKTGEPLTTAPGDEGGAMTNGYMHTGKISLGDIDSWTFNAKAGDGIVLRMGNATTNDLLDPYLRIFGPDGAPVAPVIGDYGYQAEGLAFRATSNGVFSVFLSGGNFARGGEGDYRLTVAKTGEPITTAPGDQGGPLTNGYMHTGRIDLGDLDAWTVDAKAGDSLVVRMGDSSTEELIDPYFWLFGPDGAVIQYVGGYGYTAEEVTTRATTNGTFLVVLAGGSHPKGGIGPYRITLAKNGDPIAIAPGDQGGTLISGQPQNGDIPVGDLDVWSFPGIAGTHACIEVLGLGGDAGFQPWLRVYGPDGKLAAAQLGAPNAFASFNATTNGLVTLVVGDGAGGFAAYAHTGNYQIQFQSNCLTHVAVTGHVYCACNSNAIAGASLQIGSQTLTTDSSGGYYSSSVAVGTATVKISALDYFPLTTTLTLDSVRSIQTNDFYLTNATFVLDPMLDGSVTALPALKVTSISNTLQTVGKIYSKLLADPLCVRVKIFNIDNTGKSEPVYGANATPIGNIPYQTYLNDLKKNPHPSVNDLTAIASLGPPPNTGILSNNEVALTAANLEAIGERQIADLVKSKNGGLNSQIGFDFSQMNLTRTMSPDLTKFDLQSGALHEVNEVLGIGGYGSTLVNSTKGGPYEVPETGVGPLDLYRYAQPSVRSFSLNANRVAYFSIDGGVTKLIDFSQTIDMDFGDWGNPDNPGTGNNPPLVQDAPRPRGVAPDLAKYELIALDVVGYTLRGEVTFQDFRYTPENHTFKMLFTTVPGQIYQVQRLTAFFPITWVNVSNPFVAHDIASAFEDVNAPPFGAYYRIVPIAPSP